MTASFALSMILFLSFSVMISWIGHALTSMDPHSPDLEVYHQGYHNELSKELCQEIRGIDGVKYVTGRMHIEAEVNCNKNVTTVDLISYDELQFERARADLMEGDLEKVRLQSGQCVTVYDKYNPLEVGDVLEYNGYLLEVAAVFFCFGLWVFDHCCFNHYVSYYK